jgi:hypothetical protein
MQVETMSMDPRIAAIHYKDYRKKVRAHREARMKEAERIRNEGNQKRRESAKLITQIEREDTIMMASYREMAKGARIINVATVMRNAGLNKHQKLPNLAIARASWEWCHILFELNQLCFSKHSHARHSWSGERRFLEPKNLETFARDLFGSELSNSHWRNQNGFPDVRGKAAVPAIPAYLRPEGDLENYHILFEAKWEKVAPPDPILLKKIDGNMYTVVAQWDLTDIEKAVLEGRFS